MAEGPRQGGRFGNYSFIECSEEECGRSGVVRIRLSNAQSMLHARRFEALVVLRIAFGNQTISDTQVNIPGARTETHGFASLPRSRFAIIGAISQITKDQHWPQSAIEHGDQHLD